MVAATEEAKRMRSFNATPANAIIENRRARPRGPPSVADTCIRNGELVEIRRRCLKSM